MRDNPFRTHLTGAGKIDPPESLRARSPYPDEVAYRGYLAGLLQDADGFWRAEARRVLGLEPSPAETWLEAWPRDAHVDPTGALLDRWRRADPSAMPLSDGEGWSIDATRLEETLWALCSRLAALELAASSRVLLALPRGPDLLLAMLSCLRLGLVAVPANPSPGDPGQLERRAFAAGCRGAVVSADASWTSARMPAAKRFVLDLEALLPVSEPSPAVKVSPSHPAVVFFDTAGQPYSIPVAGLLAQAVSSMERMIPGPSDSGERRGRLWLEVPGHHASFAAASLGALMSGLELVIPRPKAVADTMEQAGRMASSGSSAALVHGALLSPQAPSTADGTLAAGALELVILEGDSVGPSANALLRQRVFGGAVHVVQAVARPEVGGFVLGVDPGAVGALPGCGGLPLPGFDLSIVDHRTRRCEAGMGGFVALNRHVPGLSLELAGQEMPVVLGLRARMDRESRFWPMGEGDVLRPELEQYSVTEIETLVSGLDGVERVAVVHFTDARGVVRSVMYLETEGGADAAEAARAAIVASFGPDAAPETIWPVKRLPVTRSGKLLRSVLRRVAAGDLVGLDQVCSPHLIDGLLVPGGGSGQKQ